MSCLQLVDSVCAIHGLALYQLNMDGGISLHRLLIMDLPLTSYFVDFASIRVGLMVATFVFSSSNYNH